MGMSFQEKSTWISLVSTLCIFGYYFYSILMLAGLPLEQSSSAALGLLLQAVILIIVVETIFQGMLAATNPKAAQLGADERDKLFEYKGNQWGYWILAIGVLMTIGRTIISEQWPTFSTIAEGVNIPFATAHLLMFTFILSEAGRFAGQLFHYRKGA